jgi:hypothetical protein
MKRSVIINIVIIIILIIAGYFFYPGCLFHKIGSVFEGQNDGEICTCKITGLYCLQKEIYTGGIAELDKETMKELFSNG